MTLPRVSLRVSHGTDSLQRLPFAASALQIGGATSSTSCSLLPVQQHQQSHQMKWNTTQKRYHIRHPARVVMGHKMEIIKGRQKTGGISWKPKYPNHPAENDRNMNMLTQYADMKMRWSYGLRWNNERWKIAKKWQPIRNDLPYPAPTCAFVWHNEMPNLQFFEKNGGCPEYPEIGSPAFDAFRNQVKSQDVFCIFKSNIYMQHKVTVGDLVMAERMKDRHAGEKVAFGTVLLAGSRSWTILGKPTVPFARVKCTIEQQTLCGEKLVFRCGPNHSHRFRTFWRRRQYVTMLRVDEIEIDPETVHYNAEQVPKPDRLIDIWANRRLTGEEKELIPRDKHGRPDAAKHYDGSEHQPGSYHAKGLTESYRYFPDPGHSHWMQ
ncbi:unnamed protein product [Amoebophrya sp. A25]|nr:unnamed protein product [Amoebophrya sp. A25]|eukprot:GSA25T00006559001.1